MKGMKKVIVLTAAITLSACSSDGMNMKTSPLALMGAVGGGILGGYVGAQFGGGTGALLFTGLGAAAGAAGGYSFGASLEPSDMAAFERSTVQALDTAPDGQLQNWHNSKTGVVGTIKPVRSYYAGDGYFCRDYTATIAAPEGIGAGDGRACRLAGGAWRINGKV